MKILPKTKGSIFLVAEFENMTFRIFYNFMMSQDLTLFGDVIYKGSAEC